MKYNKEGEFDIYELFNNEKYRARLVLGFYAILIAILVITLRTGSTSNNSTKKDDTDKETVITEKDNDDENEDDDEDKDEEEDSSEEKKSFESKFVYLLQNNYEFDYKLTMDNKVVESIGKRTDTETLFDVKSYEGLVNCYGKEAVLMCNDEGSYKETDYPYFFFDYYNPKEVMKVLEESVFDEEDNKYHIDNVALYSFGDGSVDLSKVDKEKDIDNTIELIEKNGKVVGLKMNFSNLFKNDDNGFKKVLLDLNYSNFGFVDDITPPKGIN